MKLALTISTPNLEGQIPLTLMSGSFEEKLQRAARLGYDGVELLVLRPDAIDPRAIRDQVAGHGLEIAALASGGIAAIEGLTLLAADTATGQRARARLMALIDCAAQLGAPLVTLGSFRGRRAAITAGDGRAQLVEVLHQAAEHAARQGVRIALEPLNRYETDLVTTVSEGLALLDELGHQQVGLLVDTFHANIEEPSLVGCLQEAAAAHRLWHVHIGDSNRLPPGGGHLDFAQITTTLRSLHYEGYLSAELLARPDPNTAAIATIEVLRPLVPRHPRL
ncbi:MAG: sugar phosphate isomerase/epimerase [Chloroflexi bacterium OHK40]